MMMLAENNYRNMLHPEIPVESRRVIAGIKYEKRPALTFKNFENVFTKLEKEKVVEIW